MMRQLPKAPAPKVVFHEGAVEAIHRKRKTDVSVAIPEAGEVGGGGRYMIYLTDPQYTDIYRVSVGRACVGYAVADPEFLDGGGRLFG